MTGRNTGRNTVGIFTLARCCFGFLQWLDSCSGETGTQQQQDRRGALQVQFLAVTFCNSCVHVLAVDFCSCNREFFFVRSEPRLHHFPAQLFHFYAVHRHCLHAGGRAGGSTSACHPTPGVTRGRIPQLTRLANFESEPACVIEIDAMGFPIKDFFFYQSIRAHKQGLSRVNLDFLSCSLQM